MTYRINTPGTSIYCAEINTWFPNDEEHWLYQQMQTEIAAGTSELLPAEPTPVSDQRRAAYNAAGITTDELIVALWESVIEGRPEAADSIQTQRAAIKAAFPNP